MELCAADEHLVVMLRHDHGPQLRLVEGTFEPFPLVVTFVRPELESAAPHDSAPAGAIVVEPHFDGGSYYSVVDAWTGDEGNSLSLRGNLTTSLDDDVDHSSANWLM